MNVISNDILFKEIEFQDAIIDKRMKTRRLGLRECADQIGISASTLSRLENGGSPDIITYAKICKWLKVGLNKFIK